MRRTPSRVAIALLAAGVFLAGMAASRVLDRPAHGDSVRPTEPAPAPQPQDPAEPATVERSEDGAVAAALELAAAPQAWLYLADDDLEAAVRAVATPDAADRLAGEVAAEVTVVRDALTRTAGPVWWVVRPLAWKVDAYSPDRAQVSVWTVTVLSAADVAMPQSDWFVTAMDLRWDPDGWRLAATSETPGPTPQLGGRDEAWEPEPLAEALAGFQRVGSEVPS